MKTKNLKWGGVLGSAIIVSILCLSFLAMGVFTTKTASAAEDYVYPNYNDSRQYIPDDNLSGVTPWAFPGTASHIGEWKYNKRANLITDLNGNLNLSNFGAGYGESNPDYSAGDNVNFSANQINYKSWVSSSWGGANACNFWRYMYGFIQLPSALSKNGGKLTVSADTGAFCSTDTNTSYLSLAACNAIWGDARSNISITDGRVNMSTGRTNKHAGVKSDNTTLSQHSVTIVIRPDDKYARISFANFIRDKGANSDFGQRMENVRVSYALLDKTAPVIKDAKITTKADFTGGTITANVYDPQGANEEVSGMKNVVINGTQIPISANGNITCNVSQNGSYTITATDNAGNSSKVTVSISNIDKVAPVINNFKGQNTPTKGSLNVTFAIVETGSGIKEKTCTFNGKGISIGVSGSNYYFRADENGIYTLTATDYAGNKSTAKVTVTGIDKDVPIISEIKGETAVSLFSGKTITFKVTDASGVATVTYNDEILTGTNNYYSIKVNTNGKHKVVFTDTLGNIGAKEIEVTNCYFGTITAGKGVTVTSGLTGQGYVAQNGVLTIKVVGSFGQKITMPTVTNATVKENYNYGLEAEYTVTFSGLADYTQTINAKFDAIQVAVVVNGNTNSFNFGSVQTFTATDPDPTQVFIGWFNNKNVLMSTDKVISVTITSANNYAAKYVKKLDTMITYLNLADKVINIKGVQLYGEKLEDYLARQADVVAPANAYMTFAGWVILQNNPDGTVVAKATYTRTADKFNVTVNGVTTKYGYNERVTLKGDANTIGWSVNGQIVANTKDYSFFAINNVTINKVSSVGSLATEARQIAVSKTGNLYVITGLFTMGKKYDEVGFVFADGNMKDEFITFANTLVTALPVYTISNTKQIVANLNTITFAGKKVRLYTRVGNAISYSNVITLA